MKLWKIEVQIAYNAIEIFILRAFDIQDALDKIRGDYNMTNVLSINRINATFIEDKEK